MSLNFVDGTYGFTFDDVLLQPKHSTIKSRKDVDLSVNLGKDIILNIPIINANMKHVANYKLCLELVKLGGLALLHRFADNPVIDQIQLFQDLIDEDKKYINNIGVSIGIQKSDLDNVGTFIANGVRVICLDVAHADSNHTIDIIKDIKSKYGNKILLIAGNVAVDSGFANLARAGADVIKVNIGSGSICTTRIETGNGVPALTALSNIYECMEEYYPNVKIIADGGLHNSGAITKALCFSHAVMLGNLLARSDESPGEYTTVNGQKYKNYAGSSTFKNDNVEGVAGRVPCAGPVKNIIEKLLQGVRSGCSYQNAHNLEELRKDPKFILLTSNGLVESKPHDILL